LQKHCGEAKLVEVETKLAKAKMTMKAAENKTIWIKTIKAKVLSYGWSTLLLQKNVKPA
jgi:hypothetical protein